MKILLIGIAGGATVLLSDLYLYRWSADQQTIRLGLSITAFLIVTAVASFLMDPAEAVQPVAPTAPTSKSVDAGPGGAVVPDKADLGNV